MEWRTIPEFEMYEASDQGKIRNKKSGRVLKGSVVEKGYLRVSLMKDGKVAYRMVHQIIATVFIPNPDEKPFVDHKNTDTADNRVENLQWSTYSENNNNPLTRKHISKSKSGSNHPLFGKNHTEDTILKMRDTSKNVSVEQLSKDGELIRVWDSMTEAERETGIHHNNISKCCSGERKTAGGFIWRIRE